MASKLAVPQPLKWHGGKNYLAKEIISLMPPRSEWLHYVEPYFGGGAVLLDNNPEGISEVVNDLNYNLMNFWKVLKHKEYFESFQRMIECTPFSKAEWRKAQAWLSKATNSDLDCIERAADFFVVCRQSLAGRMDTFTSITKTRTRRGMNGEVSAWLSAIEGLPLVHARLKRVVILCEDALDVIRSQDGPQTLFYLDPPYLHETRSTTKEYGEFEMDEHQHYLLLMLLREIEGKFLLSGYNSPLYHQFEVEEGWKRHEFEMPNQAAGGKAKRRMRESVWCNY